MIDKKRQTGFSLIELMVGMVIGLLVTGIIITVFAQSKRNYNQDDEISQLQENGRYALQTLTREISMAGFAGSIYILGDIETAVAGTPCGFDDWYKVVDKNDATGLYTDLSILFPTSTPSCISDVKADTDIIVIKGVVGGSTATQAANKLYFRTNGKGGSVISSGDGGNSAIPPYSDWEYVVRIYYIKEKTVDDETIPTLRKAQLKSDMTWDDQELVEGIENLQITFGIDSDDDGVVNSYKTSPTAAELATAAMAKVNILVRSINEDPYYTNAKTYYAGSTAFLDALGNAALKDSKYYGKVFSSTVPMRNISYRNNL